MDEFDIIVIGAGPAGYAGAIRAARLGAKVCLVEKAAVGGVCLNRGCIPTKSLTAFVELLEKVKTSGAFGVVVDGKVTPDLRIAMKRKRDLVAGLTKGIEGLLARRGVVLTKGTASFADKKTLEVSGPEGTQRVSAPRILIATGSQPAEVPSLSFDGSTVICSDEALELEEVPRSILIVGAGAIGCEFAYILSGLGACVTVVEMMERALPLEDSDVSVVMERELRRRRITLLTSDGVAVATRITSGVKCVLKSGTEMEVEKVLVCVGRRFDTEGLGLGRAGVTRGERGEISVGSSMETSVAGTYAAGDVVGKKMYAHSASREAVVAVENALGAKKEMNYSAVPSCIFTNPQVGSVGLTQEQAVARGFETKAGVFNFRALGKAHVMGETSGFVKIIADAATDVVLGVHIIGPHASELVHEGAVALARRLTSTELSEVIHAHPTLSEAVMEAADAVRGARKDEYR
ncbi:MAG: dihydrolipoyl dehydrogenase [Candidatus Eisenbacteria bacterium]